MKLVLDLPEDLAAYVESVAGDDLSSPAAHDIALEWLADARKRREWLDRELQKGLDSGISDRTFDQIWDEAVERARSRAA